MSHWPTARPVGHQLRDTVGDQWVRFHSLPESRRYADNDADYREILYRHHAVLRALIDRNPGVSDLGELVVLTSSYSGQGDGPVPERDPGLIAAMPDARYWCAALRAVDPRTPDEAAVWTHLFVNRVHVDSPALDELLRWVADGNTLDVIISDDRFNWLYAPYDGGGDVIAATPEQRDELRDEFSAWLSPFPSGW